MPGFSSFFLAKKAKACLLCPHCRLILRDAVQTEDGDRLCSDCLEEIRTRRPHGGRCTDCGISIPPESKVYPDRAARREVASLEVFCPHKDCQWTGVMSSVEEHIAQCPGREIPCPNSGCGHRMTTAERDHHLQECPYQEELCRYCRLSLPSSILDAHHAGECQHYPFSCHKCGQQVTLDKLKSHMTVCTGPVQNHEHHDLMPADYCVTTFQARAVENTECHEVRSEAVCSGPIRVAGLCGSPLELDHRSGRVRELEQELHQRISQVEHTVRTVTGDLIPRTMFENQQQELQCIGESVQRMGHCVTQLALGMGDLCRQLKHLKMTKTHAEFTWEITDVAKRYRDARRGCSTPLLSRPFYTSQYGYKLCISAYLNGDGIGKGTHVSLFFVLMRAEHDSFLCWPFQQLVHLTLINQTTPTASITRSFNPDPTCSSFQRPETDMNIASGCPKFAHQSILRDKSFTWNDTIFIKCEIDLSGLL